jgi:hypothetical protein
VDIRRHSDKFAGLAMKSDMTNTILNFVLAFLVILGVIFALQTIFRTREFRSLTTQATVANTALMRVQALANETAAFNQKHPSPELTRILQAAQARPAEKK